MFWITKLLGIEPSCLWMAQFWPGIRGLLLILPRSPLPGCWIKFIYHPQLGKSSFGGREAQHRATPVTRWGKATNQRHVFIALDTALRWVWGNFSLSVQLTNKKSPDCTIPLKGSLENRQSNFCDYISPGWFFWRSCRLKRTCKADVCPVTRIAMLLATGRCPEFCEDCPLDNLTFLSYPLFP